MRCLSRQQILREMLQDSSAALRSIAGYHVGELGLQQLREDVMAAAQTSDRVFAEMAQGALHMLAPREL